MIYFILPGHLFQNLPSTQAAFSRARLIEGVDFSERSRKKNKKKKEKYQSKK